MVMDRVLVVATNARQREAIEGLLLHGDLRTALVDSVEDGLEAVRRAGPDVVLLVLPIDDIGGLELLRAIHAIDPRLPVILVTSHGTTDEAIETTKAGAFDYLIEPFDGPDLLRTIGQAIEAGRLMRSPVSLDQELTAGGPGDALIGRSKPMQEIYKAIGRVARTDSTVLIRGESGTGKELVARAIYQHSDRADRPFVVVNCVAIPETLLESELFGYEKGAFTGAASRRIGKVELADGGTLFLDEIGDMPLAIQAKILRLLEDRRIERIGGRQPFPVDVRIVAATNRDLEAAIADSRFRKDLFYRLNVVPISLPPLRERLDDVPLLADYFLRRLTTELGVRNPGLTPEAYRLLCSHEWPGNVRELANAMEQCLIFSRGRQVGEDEVAVLVLGADSGRNAILRNADDVLRRWVHQSIAFGRRDLLETAVDHVSRRLIAEVLEVTGGNRTRAARLLGLSRPTLLARLRKYRLD
jgi:two-component system nitrogen regulation response regulator GlnG